LKMTSSSLDDEMELKLCGGVKRDVGINL
jgi:hypothetical protein